MNLIKKLLIIVLLCTSLGVLSIQVNAKSINTQNNFTEEFSTTLIEEAATANTEAGTNLSNDKNITTFKGEGEDRNNNLDEFGEDEDEFFGISITGGKGLFYTLVDVAQSLKNLFFFLATIFYLIIAIKLIIAENTEEEVGKFKKGIIWITLGLMIMQMAYSYMMTLYANTMGEKLAFDLITNMINPFIGLMEVLASIFFLAIAIFAFYRLVTANGKEEEISRAKISILYAVMGFILIKLAKLIVEGVYGKLECHSSQIAGFDMATISCIGDKNAGSLAGNIMQIINWMNGFIGIITILLIIYAGFNIFFSAGDEEKIKKAKSTILYIIIGLFLLVVNYLLLTFFIIPETTI